MVQAQLKLEQERFDYEMTMLAWQTSLLMNSSGNFKKKIKPSDLYSPDCLEDTGGNGVGKKLAEEEVEQLRNDLLQTFANSI